MPKNDPNKPSRGRTTAYTFFVKHYKEEYGKKNPNQNLSFPELSKQASAVWKDMSDTAKAPYNKLSEKDKKRYDAEKDALSRMPRVVDNGAASGAGRGKKAKKEKDKNAPKRALSAYMWFCHDERAILKAENSELGAVDTLRELGNRWKLVSEQDKQKYEALHVKDKARYDKEMKAYKGGAGATMAAASTSKGAGSGSRGGGGATVKVVATKAPAAVKGQAKQQAVVATKGTGRAGGGVKMPQVVLNNRGDSSSEGDEEAMDESEEADDEEEDDEEEESDE